MAVLRARQGRQGLAGMTLAMLCDAIWLEIWDDCPAMGDQAQYRDIVHKLFILGTPAHQITYEGYNDKGKKVTKRLSESGPKGAPSKTQLDAARALHEKVQAAKAAAAEKARLASPNDG